MLSLFYTVILTFSIIQFFVLELKVRRSEREITFVVTLYTESKGAINHLDDITSKRHHVVYETKEKRRTKEIPKINFACGYRYVQRVTLLLFHAKRQ